MTMLIETGAAGDNFDGIEMGEVMVMYRETKMIGNDL